MPTDGLKPYALEAAGASPTLPTTGGQDGRAIAHDEHQCAEAGLCCRPVARKSRPIGLLEVGARNVGKLPHNTV